MLEVEKQRGETRLVPLTAKLVAAFLTHHQVPPSELPGVIESVYRALDSTRRASESAAASGTPAVPIKKSVRKTSIACLECGAEFTAVRRHLRTAHGLTREEYRQKWKLPSNYPFVAPAYAAQRSRMAKELGLGRRAAAASPPPTVKARTKSSRRKGKKGA